VIIDVLDSGPGVPESMLVDIFQPFFRTSPGRETETGGTSLGLTIASEAVRLRDETIAARGGHSLVTVPEDKLAAPQGFEPRYADPELRQPV
jgi:signal transduction histidine kinase